MQSRDRKTTRPGRSYLVTWMIAGALFSFVLPLLGTAIVALFFSGFQLVQIPLHSLIEGCGGLIAVAIAGILLVEMKHEPESEHYSWIAASLIAMGLLDLIHAAATLGNHFIWLHGIATLAGGGLIACVWVSKQTPQFLQRSWFLLAVAILALASGMLSISYPELLPAMKTTAGTFSKTAMVLNAGGGLGFLFAATFFIRRFYEAGRSQDWIFGVQTTLFGTAGLVFAYSVLWDAGWWWWHLLRLAAYIAALSYGLRTFRDAELELMQVNRRLAQTNTSLDRSVAERTARLRAIEERFELAVRGSRDGLWDWNILSNEVYFSPRMKELLGYQDHELPNVFATFESRLHPDDHDWVMQAVDAHLRQHKPYDVEYRLRTKSGEYRWFRARGQAIWDDSKTATRMAGSVTDVTEGREMRERFRLAVEASPAALMTVRQDGRIEMVNSKTLALFGYTHSELEGQYIEILVPERFRAGHPDKRNSFFESRTARAMGAELKLRGVRKDGSEFPARIGLSPVQMEEGPVVICGVLDTTDQELAIESMRQSKEAAESASRAKSTFLANMSHEIRTPMNGILGMTQLLARTDLKSYQRDYVSTVEESAHILLRLLNDILDFSKIEAGKLELECVDFRLGECVARASQMVMPSAAEKGLEIACQIAPGIPNQLRGDPGRLQQILMNLLGNAVKFTEQGEIVVVIDAESIRSDTIRLRFSVSDTGIGIPMAKQDEIFQPFEQAESSTTRRFGGTGLGLAISRQLVEMMQGEMYVESETGRGSTFHFTVELSVSPHQQDPLLSDLNLLAGLPVLVVDDNLTNRRILGEMLAYWQMRPVLADSAVAARRSLREAEDSQRPFRLILLDHHLPDEDGVQLAESVCQSTIQARCPVIMLSSGSSPYDADLCERIGICRWMTKPVIASDLLNEILRQLANPSVGEPSSPSKTTSPERIAPRRVLLVEDNEINRRVAVGLLQARGHQVELAVNGREAMDKVSNQAFDVVLMDMQMPVMDGYEATSAIRERERLTQGHIPIVAMTAEALKGDRERCLDAGMDDYVSKPIAPEKMYHAIEQFPANCLAGEPASPDGLTSTLNAQDIQTLSPDTDTAGLLCGSTEDPAMNWEIAQERLACSFDELHEFIELFKKDADLRTADIRRAVETRDAELLQRSAHTLKSSANYFGANSLVKFALVLEGLGRESSWNCVEEQVTKVEDELARVLKALALGPPERSQ